MAVTDARNPYHNDYSSIIAVDAVTIPVAAICVGIRIYVRRVLQRAKLGLDDWLLLAGVTMYIASNFFDIAAWVRRSSGDFRDGDPGHVLELIDILFYILAEILVRGAYTALYLRIVPLVLDLSWDRYALVTVYGLYTLFQFSMAFIYLFQCGSPAVTHNSTPTPKCINPAIMSGLFQAIYYFDCIFDCVMVLVPMRVVWKSAMSRRDRIGTLLVLSLGCCASALAVTIIILAHQRTYSQVDAADMRWSIRMDIAAACEVFVAILCLCLATYKPLFRRFSVISDSGAGNTRQPIQFCLIGRTSAAPDFASFGVVEHVEEPDLCLTTLAPKIKTIVVTSEETV